MFLVLGAYSPITWTNTAKVSFESNDSAYVSANPLADPLQVMVV